MYVNMTGNKSHIDEESTKFYRFHRAEARLQAANPALKSPDEQALRGNSKVKRQLLVGLTAGIMSLALGGSVLAFDMEPSQSQTTAKQQVSKDIVDTAVAAGEFKTLATALQAANLVATLKGTGPFTVFAPTDAAFAKLPPATLDALLKNPAELSKILTYHVVAGNVNAASVVKLTQATTVNGASIQIMVRDGKVVLNGASTVTATDVAATNGVIHVIDTVLLPPVPSAAKTGMVGPDEGSSATWLALAGLAATVAVAGAARTFATRAQQ